MLHAGRRQAVHKVLTGLLLEPPVDPQGSQHQEQPLGLFTMPDRPDRPVPAQNTISTIQTPST